MPQPETPDSPDQSASPPGLRERNLEVRRQQILRAARELLSRGGLGALSMRKLADEASLSVNTLYNLWGTREEILRALTIDARDRLAASLPIEVSPEDPIAYCRSLVGATIQGLCRQHEFFRPMILAWLEGEIEGRPSPIEPMEQSIDMLSQIIETARKSGLVECPMKPDQVAWQIQHGVRFASIQWALGRIDDVHFEARALYSVNLAFLGLVDEDRRPEIQSRLKELERKLQVQPESSRKKVR
ncbi:MAG: helix-turn-helix domain-containing protein [Myxococcota bacterium]|nr:helix-turn-helix domain-containing protein [Myxococcota bacterium]